MIVKNCNSACGCHNGCNGVINTPDNINKHNCPQFPACECSGTHCNISNSSGNITTNIWDTRRCVHNPPCNVPCWYPPYIDTKTSTSTRLQWPNSGVPMFPTTQIRENIIGVVDQMSNVIADLEEAVNSDTSNMFLRSKLDRTVGAQLLDLLLDWQKTLSEAVS